MLTRFCKTYNSDHNGLLSFRVINSTVAREISKAAGMAACCLGPLWSYGVLI